MVFTEGEIASFLVFGLDAFLSVLLLAYTYTVSKPPPPSSLQPHYVVAPFGIITHLLKVAVCMSITRIVVGVVFVYLPAPGPDIASHVIGITSNNIVSTILNLITLIIPALLIFSNRVLQPPFLNILMQSIRSKLADVRVNKISVASAKYGSYSAALGREFPSSTLDICDEYGSPACPAPIFDLLRNMIGSGVEGSRFSVHVAPTTQLPLQSNEYDLSFSFMPLRDVKKGDHQRAINEMARVLKPGGMLVMTAYSWGLKPIQNLLTNAGLEHVEVERYFRTFPPFSIVYGIKRHGVDTLQSPSYANNNASYSIQSDVRADNSYERFVDSDSTSIPLLSHVAGTDKTPPPPPKHSVLLIPRIIIITIFIGILLIVDFLFFKVWNTFSVPTFLIESERINVNVLGGAILFFGISVFEIWAGMQNLCTVDVGSEDKASFGEVFKFFLKAGILGSIFVSVFVSFFFFAPSLAVSSLCYKVPSLQGFQSILSVGAYFIVLYFTIKITGKVMEMREKAKK
eukprot:TRINITY_DN8453_c0_g2_i2.p1 TRINITY_DN8453_c0_g2~~TRINITY_DN8453_c0_g2_i2.p1  ORF type:complete len:575 (-),score=109.25 TRINITY_DN8453_c0_g2_i2:213-1754(-)